MREVYFYQFYVVLLLYFLSLLTSGKNITQTSFRMFLFHFTQLIRLSNTVSRILFKGLRLRLIYVIIVVHRVAKLCSGHLAQIYLSYSISC